MNDFIQILRRDVALRFCLCIVLSLFLAVIGSEAVLIIAGFFITIFGIESYLGKAVVVLAAQLLSLSFPARFLPKLSSRYASPPIAHFALSLLAWATLFDLGLFLLTFILLHVFLWAEVVAVYWQEKVQ